MKVITAQRLKDVNCHRPTSRPHLVTAALDLLVATPRLYLTATTRDRDGAVVHRTSRLHHLAST